MLVVVTVDRVERWEVVGVGVGVVFREVWPPVALDGPPGKHWE